MSPKVKIVSAGINIACLVTTLLYPDSTTPFVLLMTIVSTAAWAFSDEIDPLHRDVGLYLYTIAAAALATICIVLGVTSSLNGVDAQGNVIANATQVVDHYEFQFENKVFLFGGDRWSYTPIAIGMLLLIVAMMVTEIVYTAKNYNRRSGVKYSHSISSYINSKIEHIR